MKTLLFYILFVAFGCQQTTDNGQQTLSTVVGNEDARPCVSTGDYHCDSLTSTSNNAYPRTVDCCPLSVDYYKSQIRLADSLYKNYLPQYNFEEIKEAVAFFERTTDNSQQTTDFVHSRKSQQLSNSASQQLSNSASQQLSNSASQQLSNSASQQLSNSASQQLSNSASQQLSNSASQQLRNSTSQQLSNSVSCAKAHYYHAVGLTERDDIVGACEHYLRALEIMEPLVETSLPWRLTTNDKSLTTKRKSSTAKSQKPKVKKNKTVDSCLLSDDNPQDYEKVRFLALIYTRLGRLFLNENYCELAITKYKNALKYAEILGNNDSKANILKELGNSYQLNNKPDSALYYYNESLKYNSNLPNKLDVEKSIAQILFYKGEKDSTYVLLKNNLREIDNGNLKYSYYYTLGDMYFNDKKYDSALYYLETSLDNDIVTKKVAFTTKLSAIYDSLGDYDKRDYYDNFSAKMLLNHANKEVDNKQLQVLYDNYKERKNERERKRSLAEAKTRKLINAIGLSVFVILASLSIFFKYRHQRHIDKLTEEIDDYANKNKQLVGDFQKVSSKKDRIIRQQKKEIEEIKNELYKKNSVNLEAYYDSEICKAIMARKDSDFSCLKEDELALLIKSADMHLNNISTRLCEQFPTLNTNDIYTICLIILNVENNKLPHLLNRDRKTIYDRHKKIRKLMNIDAKKDLFIHIKDNYLC